RVGDPGFVGQYPRKRHVGGVCVAMKQLSKAFDNCSVPTGKRVLMERDIKSTKNTIYKSPISLTYRLLNGSNLAVSGNHLISGRAGNDSTKPFFHVAQHRFCALHSYRGVSAWGFTAQCIRNELLDTLGRNCWTPTAVCN